MATAGFVEAHRELSGLTAGVEKRVLLWLAARVPERIGPDHLTVLGLLATAAAGWCYASSRNEPLWLLAVNLCLAVNWFGDSLDGTLARHRRRLRPRYGFYVDHMADAFGALCLLAGLGLSGYMSPAVAAALLIVYYLLSLHIYLATYTQGHFKISYGPIGGTELRLLLAAANLWVLFRPQATFLGSPMKLFDVIALFAVAGLVIVVAFSVARSVRELYEVERL